MKYPTRRTFMAQSAALGAGITILANAKSVSANPANDRVTLALIGCGGRGGALSRDFNGRQQKDVQFLYCCDPFTQKAGNYAQNLKFGDAAPQAVADMREALDDPALDAVVIATPDHWHALATIRACQAGKDVYVEKPSANNPFEGEKMVAAMEKYARVVQVGSQNRSAPYNFAAKKYIEEGKLGKIHLCKVYNMKLNDNGNCRLSQNTTPPAEWDAWRGPAALDYAPEYMRHWSYFWPLRMGDFGNDGIHQLDLARWLIGQGIPKSAYSVGGVFDSEGDKQVPDTQMALYDYDDMTLSFELTQYTPYMLKTDGQVRNSDMFPYWMQNATRIEIYGTEGLMMVGRHGGGWEVYVRPKDRKPVVKASEYGRFPDPEHKENFLQCVRSRQKPNASVEIAHVSTLLCCAGCASLRLGGRKIELDRKTGRYLDSSPEVQALYRPQFNAGYDIPEEV